MEPKAKFKIVYSEEADNFLNLLPSKVKEKIIYNIAKSKFVIDPELFKKLDNTDIWEFRTLYNKTQYNTVLPILFGSTSPWHIISAAFETTFFESSRFPIRPRRSKQ